MRILARLGCLFLLSEVFGFAADLQIHALYTEEDILIDGNLEEPVWSRAEASTGFIQQEPRPGNPASEKTEVRILYDEGNLYIGVICFDSDGRRGVIVNDLARDFDEREDDVFEVIIDTFNDNQNGFLFATNARGAKFDAQVTNDGSSFNEDWDTIWQVGSEITEEGWQTEIAIPFKSLRFGGQEEQEWGINFMRRIRRKAEEVYWSPIPQPFRLSRVSLAGSLNGIGGVRQGRNFYVKPYIKTPLSRLEDDDVDLKPEVGFDVKWGVTSQLTLDLTVNTDFSQVEADEEQVNLTRFSLFFPEKREFFLENAGFFGFGEGVGIRRRGGGGRGRSDLIPFFSRRIGVSDGGLVPILGGSRLTGRAGAFTLGLLSMQTDDFEAEPSTNFSVVRVRRDFRDSSNVGVLFINKEGGDHFNRTYGVDGNFNFFRYLSLTSFLLKTETPGLSGKDGAGKFEMGWQDPFWRIRAGFFSIEENFNPEVGFVRRGGYDRDERVGHSIRKSNGEFGFAFRPEDRIPWIREIQPSLEPEYITDQDNLLLTREVEKQVRVEFNDSSRLFISHDSTFERLDEPFEIRDDQTVPVGDYGFSSTRISFRGNESRKFSVDAGYTTGGFFNGELDSYELEFLVQPSYRFKTELLWEHNDISLPDGDFSTDVVGTKIQYAFSTTMFVNALIQYNSEDGEISSNIRFNLIHKPLSDLFIVYNENRLTHNRVRDRALIVKFTHLFSF
ncbi:carbohydrate binding family 9 domain-containing protein [Acidobacteria bacterium AH-259-A15]|nr:carbohydrate binding family 9 domain-containing protein [Acidobacteria bacterium AH-259-A15]